ncbi:MAG: hypothetical protein LBI10_10485, partial [Deltaproteobacteria bacterium]|nr:hypothetical protein [Deltaproteobacteria bacterium]
MPRKKTAPPRRRLLKALAILVALGLVAFFSVFFFLRTTTGENYVFAFLQRSLASQGLTLTAGSFAGPLPLNVTATDVTLADSLGTFLTVRSLSAKVGFWNFFRGILKGEAAVVGADLKRQPLLPAAEEKPKKFSSPPFSLDLAVSLTESTVAGATLNPTNPGPQIAATVQTQLFYATDRLTFNLLASLLDDQGRGLKLAAALGRAESTGPETLNLDLALTDEAGIVALSRPDLPKRLSLTLKGQGPLHEWRGQLKLTGQDDAAASRETAASQEAAEIPKIVKNLKASVKRPAAEELAGATIVWRGRTGRVMEDLFSDPHFTGELDLWALAKLIPNEARPVLPNLAPLKPNAVLSLIAKAIRSPDEIQGDLALTTPYAALNSPKFVVTSDQGAYKISLNATLTPGQLFNLTLANPAIDLELAGLIEGQTQKFDRLTLKGEGLTALIAAENNPQSQDAAVTLTLAPDSVVYAILKVLAPLAVAPGALTVDLKANRDPNDATLKATGQVALANLGALVPNWGGAVLADFDLTGRPNDFKVNLTATSPSLSHPTGPYSQTSFTGVFDYQAVLDGLKVLGEVKLAAISPKAPLDLAATFDLERRPGEFFLSLANFKLAAPGVTAESQAFKLAIYPDQAPDLAGALTFKALDWPLLGSLIGQDLKGAPATLEARLIPGPLPVAEATLNLPELKAGDYLAIKDARLNLTASLGVDAKANLNLTQGPGRIGTLDLKSGRIEASAAGLWSEGLAGTVKIKLIGPTKDLLDLEGAYDLKAKTATLSQLRLGPPQLKNVLSLSHPLSLDLKDGLKFTDLNLALNQGGQLTASAEILGTSPYAIKLVAQSLPLNATDPGLIDLPAGVVNLKADYLEGTGGSFEVKTRLNGPPILDLS